jgi:hypothetical protein
VGNVCQRWRVKVQQSPLSRVSGRESHDAGVIIGGQGPMSCQSRAASFGGIQSSFAEATAGQARRTVGQGSKGCNPLGRDSQGRQSLRGGATARGSGVQGDGFGVPWRGTLRQQRITSPFSLFSPAGNFLQGCLLPSPCPPRQPGVFCVILVFCCSEWGRCPTGWVDGTIQVRSKSVQSGKVWPLGHRCRRLSRRNETHG